MILPTSYFKVFWLARYSRSQMALRLVKRQKALSAVNVLGLTLNKQNPF